MDKDQVIKRLCDLVSIVGHSKFYSGEYDCFCGHNKFVKEVTVSEDIIDFITEAVNAKLKSS